VLLLVHEGGELGLPFGDDGGGEADVQEVEGGRELVGRRR
jgi:hypothetical protein